jgi:hypothetical protein
VLGKREFPSWSSLGRWAKRDCTTVDAMFLEADRLLADAQHTGEPPAPVTHTRPNRRHRVRHLLPDGRPRPRGQPPGVPRLAAIRMFVDEQGAFPGESLLRWWSRTCHGISLATADRTHGDALAAVAAQLRLDGRKLPDQTLTMRDVGRLKPTSSALSVFAPKPKRGWTIEDCAQAIPIVEGLLKPSERLSLESWQRATEGRRDIPSRATVARLARKHLGLTFAEFIT